MRSVHQPLLGAGAAALLTAAACTDDPTGAERSAPDTVEAAGGATTQPPPQSDGVLTIGVLLPQTGPGSTIGIPGTVAAELAIAAINETNVFDDPVRIVKADEGATVEEARAAIATLLGEDVDAVVGPASSLVAVEVLDELMDAGVVTCSPAATSIALDDFPNSDLFFRTVPSDSLAADAIAAQAKRTGVTAVTLVYVDDGFGRPFARDVVAALGDEELEITAEVPLAANDDDDFADEAAALGESDTGTIIIIADSQRGWSMLTALAEIIDNPPAIIVNDAMRKPPALDTVTMLPVPFREAIQGVSPLATQQFDEEPDGPYATYSYDCVNLIALASLSAESDVPRDIADNLRRVAGSGAGCEMFDDCASKVEANLDIDYNGPSRRLDEIGDDGDPSRGSFATFAFDGDGLDFERGPLRISD